MCDGARPPFAGGLADCVDSFLVGCIAVYWV